LLSYIVIFLLALSKFTDITFFLISIREIIFAPFLCLLVGYTIALKNISFIPKVRVFLSFNVIIMLFFSFALPSLSYGMTGRLTSFYQGEHLPGIFASLAIIFIGADLILTKRKPKYYETILIILSLLTIILSSSRSVILALVFSLLVQYFIIFRPSLSNVFRILSILIFFVFAYLFFSERDLLYNISARLEQYEMALNLISDHFFTGVGIDKYGHLGDKVKVLHYGYHTTTTMDSSLLKYAVNSGVPMLIFLLIYSAFLIKTSKNAFYKVHAASICIFGLIMGILTGKLGSYPINYFLYVFLGMVAYRK